MSPEETSSLPEAIVERAPATCLYGLAPPKLATPPGRLEGILSAQLQRLRQLSPDGVVVYDIQDEPGRTGEPRPFPFLPTVEPGAYADALLDPDSRFGIIYRSVARDSEASLSTFLWGLPKERRATVLVGAPSRDSTVRLSLKEAQKLAANVAPGLLQGGIAIAERHLEKGNEHERLVAKMQRGCQFFVTQAVYDASATKSLLSDYYLALGRKGDRSVPLFLTFSPCLSAHSLKFMKWLGISVPRWLENELLLSDDIAQTSVSMCEQILDDVLRFARPKGLCIGVNVESISIRREEIEAASRLLKRLRDQLTSSI